MTPPPRAFFLPAADGEQRLCVFHAPTGAPKNRVLYLHPLAEEMNKSRRMAALACRALAESGSAVLQIDLRGCGDSSADFGDVSWLDWQADVRLALEWLDAQVAAAPLWLWSLRSGALLAASEWGRSVNHLFWQPVTSGKLALQQFLRLRLAAEMASGDSKGVMAQLKAELSAGRSVEIAGYTLSPALAHGLEATKLAPPLPAGRMVWLELNTRHDAACSPASEQALQHWRDAGWATQGAVVTGPSFWATAEIEVAPALIAATVEALT